MTASHAPASTAAFYLRRVVHLAAVIDGTPADHALCGMNLQYGAIDTTADATCGDCRTVAARLEAAAASAEVVVEKAAELEVPEYLRPVLDAYGAALDAHGQTYGESPACSCGAPFRTRRGVGLHVSAAHKRAEREYTAAAAIARNRHRTANLSSTERLAAQYGVPVEQVAATAREVVEETLAPVEVPYVTAVLTRRFYDDHVARDLPAGIVIGGSPRTVRVELDRAAYDELLSDARHYADPESGFGPEFAGLIASARTTVSRLEAVGRPAGVEPVHYTREQIAERFREADEFALVLGPQDTAYDPETGDTLLGGVTVRYARGEFPGPSYTATIERDEAEQRAADADTATGTDADRVTISARASELRPGDLVVDVLGTRQYAAFDVQLDDPADPVAVRVWTAVADQERGLAPVLTLNARRELLVSRRLTPEQQAEAAELFGDRPTPAGLDLLG